MAGSNMKDIRLRIRSVEGTMQITKAMQLVAASKLRKAKERVERTRPFFELVYDTMLDIATFNKELSSDYIRPRPVKTSCYVVIGGDRGLAGGYNANLMRFADGLIAQGAGQAVVVPLGRKAAEHFARRARCETLFDGPVEDIGLSQAFSLAEKLCDMYRQGVFDELFVVYSNFVSVLSQRPECRRMLPIALDEQPGQARAAINYTTYDPDCEEVLNRIVPQHVGGLIYGAVCEAFASEQGARRMAMEAATDNAEEMIATLNLQYNQARQGAITQEITEIVSGANAM